jgi:heptosyltransferase-3
VQPPTSPESILVICTRRIGDVLLTTPVVRSLKRAYPDAAVDVLLFEGTQGILAGNPDVSAVLAVAERPGAGEQGRLLRRIWRRYDLAVSVLAGDRPTLYAWAAGRYRIGTLEQKAKSLWKRALLHAWVPFDDFHTHTVIMNLRVIERLGVKTLPEPVVGCPPEAQSAARAAFPELDSERVAVLHVSPKFPYKRWSAEGWGRLAHMLTEKGMRVAIAGGASGSERQYVQRLLPSMPNIVDLAGRIDLSTLACIISRAALYVGTDTAVTHMAAALGVPTVALFGPSNPVKWGPWPKGWSTPPSPYVLRGTQLRGNVALVQGEGHCVPCLQEGCARTIESESACLQMLRPETVIAAVEKLEAAMAGRE